MISFPKFYRSTGTILFLLHLTSDLVNDLNIGRMYLFAVCIFSAAQLVAESSVPVFVMKNGEIVKNDFASH